jgi:hypothetical protein
MRFDRTQTLLLQLEHALAASAEAELIAVEYAASDGGVFVIDETGAGEALLGPSGAARLNSLAVNSSGVLYSTAQTLPGGEPSDTLVTIDRRTGAAALVASLSGITDPDIRALAFAPDGTLYGIHFESSTSTLIEIDPDNGQITIVAALAITGIQGLEFGPGGVLYGWGTYWGLVTIDTSDGSHTDIGLFAGGSPIIQTLAFTPDGTLYGAGSRLFTIDDSSGTFVQVGTGTLPDIRGMVSVPELPPTIPALGEWGSVALCGLLMAFGSSIALRRRTCL